MQSKMILYKTVEQWKNFHAYRSAWKQVHVETEYETEQTSFTGRINMGVNSLKIKL